MPTPLRVVGQWNGGASIRREFDKFRADLVKRSSRRFPVGHTIGTTGGQGLEECVMQDLLMIAVTGVFFAVCVGYVAMCDRVVGPDGEVDDIDEHNVSSSLERADDPVGAE